MADEIKPADVKPVVKPEVKPAVKPDVNPTFGPTVVDRPSAKSDRKALEREADAADRNAREAATAKEDADREAALKAHAAGRVPESGPLVNPGPPRPESEQDRPRKQFRVLSDGLGLWRKGHEFNDDELPEGADVDHLIDIKAIEEIDDDE